MNARLLDDLDGSPATLLDAHLALYGELPSHRALTPESVIELVDRAGLRGHGGASFPTAKKMRAVAPRRRPKVVVVNATEGEPASRKDRVLLRQRPHLVLDGAALAAHAVGASEAIVAFPERDRRSADSLAIALDERHRARLHGEPRFRLFGAPERYLAGQESALVNLLNGGACTPTFGPRPFERGVRQRPTLVQNAETLAHIALIARNGADWFRQRGTAADPGTTLVTLSGAVRSQGVYEIDHGQSLAELLQGAGPSEPLRAVLVGGYFGSWLTATEIPAALLAPHHLRELGASLGAGVVVALGQSSCPVAETSRVADWFAAQSAGQCGPCVNGLGAISDTVQRLATGTAARSAYDDLARWANDIRGRGACQHPDGAARFVSSSVRTFADEFDDHAQHGRCEACQLPAVLPTPLIPELELAA